MYFYVSLHVLLHKYFNIHIAVDTEFSLNVWIIKYNEEPILPNLTVCQREKEKHMHTCNKP